MSAGLEALGLLGTILYASACVPLAWKAVRDGLVTVPPATSWTFFAANCAFATYCFGSFGVHLPFFLVLVEVVCWGTVLKYTYFPRRHAKP
jgi:hypothetical protein